MLLDDHGFLLLTMIDITAILTKEGMTIASGTFNLFPKRELLVQMDIRAVLCRRLIRRRLVLCIVVPILLLSLEVRVRPLMPEHLISLVLIQNQILIGVDAGQFINEGWLR